MNINLIHYLWEQEEYQVDNSSKTCYVNWQEQFFKKKKKKSCFFLHTSKKNKLYTEATNVHELHTATNSRKMSKIFFVKLKKKLDS